MPCSAFAGSGDAAKAVVMGIVLKARETVKETTVVKRVCILFLLLAISGTARGTSPACDVQYESDLYASFTKFAETAINLK